ncbi:hypothetical protein [Micromonospora sp. WMMD998]|uniref:hypothetical protein n=1 Tax=Micromonospora sp. WMMD998 TaxID=3016092 RepID=UPI00249AEC59|nr:hypothetical protein [Micromonospora sp. WMMD998]WFE41934.1 hypothetical protein O7619_27200 [Micromonospora sp. WMMD998]
MTDRTFRLETRDERGLIIRIDVRTVSTFDEFMAAAAALGAEVLPRHGHAAEPEQPDWHHQIVFAADGTWEIDAHPAYCPAARPCTVERLATAQLPRAELRTGLAGLRFECAVNDLRDTFLIGDRVDADPTCDTPEPASDDTTVDTNRQAEG